MNPAQSNGLSEVEIGEINTELSHYPDPSAAAIGALKIVQQHRGWVSDDSLREVARLLGMSPAELDSVATFYNLIFRKPIGKKVIFCCDSVGCWIVGADRLQKRISQQLGIGPGDTTADGEFTLLPTVCLGACDHAPVLMLNETLHLDVDEAKLDQILGDGGEHR